MQPFCLHLIVNKALGPTNIIMLLYPHVRDVTTLGQGHEQSYIMSKRKILTKDSI